MLDCENTLPAIKAPDGTTVEASRLCEHQAHDLDVLLWRDPQRRNHSAIRDGLIASESVVWTIAPTPREDGLYPVRGVGSESDRVCLGAISAKCRADWLAAGIATEDAV